LSFAARHWRRQGNWRENPAQAATRNRDPGTVKLYDFRHSPSPRRVRIFLAEKDLAVPTVTVDLYGREQFLPAFKAINPDCTLPLLELDDGTTIGESVAICRYFEEIRPDPPLFGRDPRERALVEMWNRRVEFNGYLRAVDVMRNGNERFADRGLPGVERGVPQIPALVERGRAALDRFYDRLDGELATRPFIAGEDFSIADITGLVTIDFATRAGHPLAPGRTHLERWYQAVKARRSAGA